MTLSSREPVRKSKKISHAGSNSMRPVKTRAVAPKRSSPANNTLFGQNLGNGGGSVQARKVEKRR